MTENNELLTKLNELFEEEPFNKVEEELFQWYLFVYNGKGKGISDLDSCNYELFKQKLTKLLDVVYSWKKEEQRAKGRNEN